ncbi:MAG TPA: EAL domain-containing protein [Burkholderiaceae bacterium]|nr:EAL domain-containing protein [Burkholderiaceae bacterium]
MIPALLLNAGVNLAVGIGLLLVWRADRTQLFSRWLGWSFVTQALVPPAYVVFASGVAPWAALAQAVLVVVAAVSLTLWIVGVSHLAGLPLTSRQMWAGAVLLVLVGGAIVAVDPRAGQAVSATLTALAGAIALLWGLRGPDIAERVAGVAMVLLGLNQFIFVAHGEERLQWQAGIATTLRVVLGLALFYAAAQRSRSEAERMRQQLVAITERSHQGVAVMQGEEMKYANPALLQIYGLPPDGGVRISTGQQWRDATMPENERELARVRHRKLVSGELAEDHWEGERRAFDGRPLHLRFSAWRIDWDGQPAEQIVVTDDTVGHNAAQTLLHQATHDELTGLPNRSALLQYLRELCERGPAQPFALLLLDIDRFKLFNEAHGPSVGDEVLRALADALHAALKSRAPVMRLGEDEFALLAVPDAPLLDAERTARELAQQVQTLLMQPLVTARHEFFLDVSMGVALYPANARGPEALLRAANAAMHEAKRTPGTSLQFAEERFARGSGATLESEQALRAGIKSDEFTLVYQPKVDAASGAPVGFEALVRWDRPGVGRIGPVEFIPAAERTGLIGPLGNLILTQACQQIAEWREAFGRVLPVAVNVSPLQLLDPGFPELVLRTLRHYDVPPQALSLEITEGAVVAHMEQARERIGHMRSHGVEVALDDFGTGFSSLNMLRSLPLTAVKIDRTLIDPMPAPDATAIVKAICDLAAVLRLEVVAEGVETVEHASAALSAGCRVLQGYLYARPLEAREAAGWLQRTAGQARRVPSGA